MNILLVEDNDIDAFITDSYLKRANADCRITRLTNGQEAINYFEESKASNDLNLVLLDLNLPIVGGKEVLMKIKSIIHLKSLPIVVLSSSANDSDLIECQKYANDYLEKPFDELKAAKILLLAN